MDEPSSQGIPLWVAVVGAVGSALMPIIAFVIAQGLKWKTRVIELKGQENKVTLEQQKGRTDLEIRITDTQVEHWKKTAEFEAKRADDSDKKCEERVKAITAWWTDQQTRWHERERVSMQQHEEREMQFQQLIEEIRKDLGDKIDAANHKHEDCLRENAKTAGRVYQLEQERDRVQRDLEQMKSRLEAQSMRKKE